MKKLNIVKRVLSILIIGSFLFGLLPISSTAANNRINHVYSKIQNGHGVTKRKAKEYKLQHRYQEPSRRYKNYMRRQEWQNRNRYYDYYGGYRNSYRRSGYGYGYSHRYSERYVKEIAWNDGFNDAYYDRPYGTNRRGVLNSVRLNYVYNEYYDRGWESGIRNR